MSGTEIPALVSCEWLKGQLDKGLPSDIVLVDVSWSSKKNCHDEYKKDHIPGAVFLNVMEADHNDLYPRNIPSIEVFERNVQEAGINNDSHVIVYSDSDNMGYFMSGRGWWNFKIFGHDKVSILDGGLQKWKALGYSTSSDIPNIQKGTFKAKWTPKYYKTLEDVKKNMTSAEFLVCDSRPSTSYLEQDYPYGKDAPSGVLIFGHCSQTDIPILKIKERHLKGAVNVPFGNLVNKETLTLKTLDQLQQELQELGMDLNKSVITHCNSGMSSCTLAFVTELCGNQDVAVYHGGFTELKAKEPNCIEK